MTAADSRLLATPTAKSCSRPGRAATTSGMVISLPPVTESDTGTRHFEPMVALGRMTSDQQRGPTKLGRRNWMGRGPQNDRYVSRPLTPSDLKIGALPSH